MNSSPKPTSSSTPFSQNLKKKVEFADEQTKKSQRSLDKQFNTSRSSSQTNRSYTSDGYDENIERVDVDTSQAENTITNNRPPFTPILNPQRGPLKKRSYTFNNENAYNDLTYEPNKADLDITEGDIASDNEQEIEEEFIILF
jgi:hypothetical protein